MDILRYETATVYRWPTGEKLTKEQILDLTKKKK
jgi:hypothetical protein